MRFEVEGLEEATRKLRSLFSALEARQVEQVLVKGVRRVRDRFRDTVAVLTGRLKSSAKAAKGKRRGAYVASAYAAADLKRAPHAYLVEHGTSQARASPRFSEAYEAEKSQVEEDITAGLKALVKGAIR